MTEYQFEKTILDSTHLKAAGYRIIVEFVRGSRGQKKVSAVRGHMDSVYIWEGKATPPEMRRLVQELKARNLVDPNTPEQWPASHDTSQYYVP